MSLVRKLLIAVAVCLMATALSATPTAIAQTAGKAVHPNVRLLMYQTKSGTAFRRQHLVNGHWRACGKLPCGSLVSSNTGTYAGKLVLRTTRYERLLGAASAKTYVYPKGSPVSVTSPWYGHPLQEHNVGRRHGDLNAVSAYLHKNWRRSRT